MLLAIVIVELFVLYLLSNRLTKGIYTLLYFLFRSKYVAISILTFIYLPGTIVHELSHLIVAEVLRVPTGEISFTPKFIRDGPKHQEIEAGSLNIANTDPLRRYLIGFAPVVIGIACLLLLMWFFQRFWPEYTDPRQRTLLVGIIGYLLFVISNSMFSSKRDLEGFPAVLVVLLLIGLSLYLAGVRFGLTGKALDVSIQILTGLARALGVVIGVNVLIVLINSLILRGFNRLFPYKIS